MGYPCRQNQVARKNPGARNRLTPFSSPVRQGPVPAAGRAPLWRQRDVQAVSGHEETPQTGRCGVWLWLASVRPGVRQKSIRRKAVAASGLRIWLRVIHGVGFCPAGQTVSPSVAPCPGQNSYGFGWSATRPQRRTGVFISCSTIRNRARDGRRSRLLSLRDPGKNGLSYRSGHLH